VALSALSGGISSGLAGTPLFAGSNLDKLLARSTVGNVLTQGVGVVTGLQSSFSWRGVAASAAGAVAGHVAGKLLGDVVDTASWDPWAKEMVTRTGAGLAAGTAASIAQGGRVSMQQVATDAFGNALGWSLANAPGQPIPVAPPEERSARYFAPFKPLERGPGVQLAQAEIHLGDVWNVDGVDMQAPVFDWSRMDNPGEVNVSATRTDWTNPFADPTLSAAQWTVANITNVARGATVPQTYTNAQLFRPAQSPSSVNALQRSGGSSEVAGIEKSRSKALPAYLQIPGGPERYTVLADNSRIGGLPGDLLDKLDNFNNSPIGMALQGLPPEGLAIGGIKAGLHWIGKADNATDALNFRLNPSGPTSLVARDPVVLTAQRRLNSIDGDVQKFRPDEAGVAAEMENYLRGTLDRAAAGTSADFIVKSGPFTGIRMDLKLTPDSFAQANKLNTHFDKTFPKFLESFSNKLAKSDGVDLMPFDTRFLTPENSQKLFDFIQTLPLGSQKKLS
jgi:hypothetical protein